MVSGPKVPRRLPAWRWFVGLLAAGAAGQEKDAGDAALEGLISNSPFSAVGQTIVPDPGAEARLEYRGFVTEDGRTIFSIHNTARGRSAWLAVGEAEDGILVKGHDFAGETVTVEFQGRSHTLALRRGRIVAIPPQQPHGEEPFPPPNIRDGIRNRSIPLDQIKPYENTEWYKDFVRQWGPPIYEPPQK